MATLDFNWLGTSDAVTSASSSILTAATSSTGIVVDNGGVTTTFKLVTAGDGSAELNQANTSDGSTFQAAPTNSLGINTESSLRLGSSAGTGASSTATFTFDGDASLGYGDEVTNATFIISDIGRGNYRDQVIVTATDINGNPVTVTLTPMASPDRIAVSGSGTNTATVTADNATGGNRFPDDPTQAVIVSFGGPVHSISVQYLQAPSSTGNTSTAVVVLSDLKFDTTVAPPICFAAGTLIETDRGTLAIEDLAVGDLVVTRDNGMQPIRWIGSHRLSAAGLDQNPTLRPIRIRRHALGANLPSSDLVVSPQHRVLVRSAIAQKMFGTDEVLVAAKQLCQMDGIDIASDLAGVTYFHMLFDQHEVVISNGAETESLFTGTEALKSVGAAAREEIFAIFPELRDDGHEAIAARPLVSGRMGRKLAVRHAQNHKALVR